MFDWEVIAKVDIESLLRDDETSLQEKMDSLYHDIIGAPIDPNCSIDNLCHLLRVSQVVLQHKNDNLIETKEILSEKDIQIQEQALELKRLRMVSVNGSQEDIRALQEELIDIEKRYETSMRDMETIADMLEQERQMNANMQAASKEDSVKLMMLQNSNKRLEADLREARMQLSTQRGRLNNRKVDEDSAKNILAQKNLEINRYIEEVQNLGTENEALTADLEEVTKELEAAMDEIEKKTKENQALGSFIQDFELKHDELIDERDALRIKVEDLSDHLEKDRNSHENEIFEMGRDIKKLEIENDTLQNQIAEKEKKIVKMNSKIKKLTNNEELNQLQALRIDVADKEMEIIKLKTELENSKKDFELLALEWDRFDKMASNGTKDLMGQNQKSTKILSRVESNKLQDKIEVLSSQHRRDLADNEKLKASVIEKETEILQLRLRLEAFESGDYGIKEALGEINVLRARLALEEKHCEEYIKKISDLESQSGDLVEEVIALRDKLGMEFTSLDISNFKNLKLLELEKSKSLVITLQSEIERLEEERLELKSKMRLQALNRGERAMALGLSAQDLVSLEDFSEKLKAGRISIDNIKSSIPVVEGISTILQQFEKNFLDAENIKQKFRAKELEVIGLEHELESRDRQIKEHEISTARLNEEKIYINGRLNQLERELNQSREENSHLLELLKTNQVSKNGFKKVNLTMESILTGEIGVPMLLEQLYETLVELETKSKILEKVESRLQQYETNLKDIAVSSRLLYKNFANLKKDKELEIKSLRELKQRDEQTIESLQVKISSIEEVTNMVSNTPDPDQQVIELRRKYIVSQVDCARYKRLSESLEQSVKHQLMEIKKLMDGQEEMDKVARLTIMRLTISRNEAVDKMHSISEAFAQSIPLVQYENLKRKYLELQGKESAEIKPTSTTVENQNINSTRSTIHSSTISNDLENQKILCEIASENAHRLSMQNTELTERLSYLQQVIREFQVKDSDKMNIGILHNEILQLKKSEFDAKQVVDQIKTKCIRLENTIVKQESMLMEKDSLLFEARIHSRKLIVDNQFNHQVMYHTMPEFQSLLPDKSLTSDQQLEILVRNLVELYQAKRVIQDDLGILGQEKKDLEQALIDSNKIIEEKQLQLKESKLLYDKLKAEAAMQEIKPSDPNLDNIRMQEIEQLQLEKARIQKARLQDFNSIKFAKESMNSLQIQLEQKNSMVLKYQRMVKKAREELISLSQEKQLIEQKNAKLHNYNVKELLRLKKNAIQDTNTKHEYKQDELEAILSLQRLLAVKEELISKQEHELKEARAQMNSITQKHIEEKKSFEAKLTELESTFSAETSRKAALENELKSATLLLNGKTTQELVQQVNTLQRENEKKQGEIRQMKPMLSKLKSQLSALSKELVEARVHKFIETKRFYYQTRDIEHPRVSDNKI